MKPSAPGTEPAARCHLCGSENLRLTPEFAALARITSDCKPWPVGGTLGRCWDCGLVQTAVTPRWQAEVRDIYAAYTIYHQAAGKEQSIFAAPGAAGHARSEVIVRRLLEQFALPSWGMLLDVGCGNGSFLRACSSSLPGWKLWGSEVDDKYASQVMSIPGVEQHHSGALEDLAEQFDVISLIHVLEHIPGPHAFLQRLWDKLEPGGLLVVEVPDARLNPFAMVVADHCSHFTPGALAEIVSAAGFEVLEATGSWVPREVSVVAKKSSASPQTRAPRVPDTDGAHVLAGAQWLAQIAAEARPLACSDKFGIFGTSLGGTWLEAQTGLASKFFVDEDLNRIGQQVLGKPVIAPAQIAEGAVVYVALPQPLAGRIALRLARAGISVHQPPPLPAEPRA